MAANRDTPDRVEPRDLLAEAAPAPDGCVYNFAFGSNMNPLSLSSRRRIFPAESFPGRVHGWALSFEYGGIPFAEPGFGTLVEAPPNVVVHGVVHCLTLAEMERLRATEGGGGRDDVPGYRLREVVVECYDDRLVRAVAFVATPDVMVPGTRASQRYVGLLANGARISGLDPDYIAYVDAQQTHHRTKSGIAFAVLAVLLGAPVFLLRLLCGCNRGYSWAPIRRALWWLNGRMPPAIAGSISVAGIHTAIVGGAVFTAVSADAGALLFQDLHVVRGVIVASPSRVPGSRRAPAELYSVDGGPDGDAVFRLSDETRIVDASNCVILPLWFIDDAARAARATFLTAFRSAIRAEPSRRVADVVKMNAEFPTATNWGVRRGNRCACIMITLPVGVVLTADTPCSALGDAVVRGVFVDGVVHQPSEAIGKKVLMPPSRPLTWKNLTGTFRAAQSA